MKRYQWNHHVTGLSCIRCDHEYAPLEFFSGCPRCQEQGYPSNLLVKYDNDTDWESNADQKGMMKYQARLPYTQFPTLGEGNTPLVDLPNMAQSLGVASFQLKNESQNPTGSHKDRCSPLVVARALECGANTIVTSSSGNAGLSLAAYAAYVGLRCVVISQDNLHERLRTAIEGTGAELVLTKGALERWELMRQLVEQEGYHPATNFSTPPVGSHLYGIQGYKTVAYELYDPQKGSVPDVIVVPTSRADLLWGIQEGFSELYKRGRIFQIPRLVAVEPTPRLSLVLKGADYRGQFLGETRLLSIGGSTVTWQGVRALKDSKGCAIVIEYDEAVADQNELLHQGLYFESSSSAVVSAVRKLLAQGWLSASDHVVVIGTSHAWKGI